MSREVLRYSLNHIQNRMVPEPDGAWVLHELLASKIEELERERNAAIGVIGNWKRRYEFARREALEEVASSRFLRPLIEEQSEGEWDDKTIDRDVVTFAKAIRALMEKGDDE